MLSRVLWSIEYRLPEEVGVRELAEECGVSRFHLSRAFVAATGFTISGYLRARRLSRAAAALRDGADGVLGVALDHGYGSHEAFTRAFRDQFGVTPTAVRGGAVIPAELIMEPIRMTETATEIGPPRLEERESFRVVGIGRRFSFENAREIPGLWREFDPHFGAIPGQEGAVAYGVCHDGDGEGFAYLAGAAARGPVPEGMVALEIPAGRYAVWIHRGHVSNIRATWAAIWSHGLTASGLRHRAAPDFELYDDARFDPESGEGEVEIWLPVEEA